MARLRKSTGKRLRIEVFKRDYFTCQYCGQHPPTVVLVVDHIIPVAEGGQATIDNLITSCEACNQGKADKPLGERAIRPDADLLYLSVQQELAEMRRYQQALQEKEAALADLIHALQDAWIEASGLDWHPSDRVLRQLLTLYPPDIAGQAMLDVAVKVGGGYIKKWVGYMFTIARNLVADEDDEESG